MPANPTPPPRRKIVMAVDDPELRGRLEELLAREHIEVAYRPDLTSALPGSIEADMVVLSGDDLDRSELPDILTSGQDQDAPGVVVLEPRDGASEVDLVTAGASAVLDPDEATRRELADRLVELANAEIEGGLHGPEAAGSVAEPKLADFLSSSPRMRAFIDMVARVTHSDSTLLITGETGVGKERLARAIHAESPRADGPFVAVNCGALPETLLESELFGHRKGAFTGAERDRTGRFEAAAGGTLFLDEIAELPLPLQVKLLTVLQRHEVRPLGAVEPRPLDVRVLAATNRDVPAEVRAGRFREDLFYRLNVVSLVIPPLRDRAEDLPWLIGRFLRHFTETHGRPDLLGIEPEALERMLAYRWPGNVRELINVIERAVLLSRGDRVGVGDLPAAVRAGATARPGAEPGPGAAVDRALLERPLAEARRRTTEAFERRYLEHHLKQAGGKLGEVARRAGINPRTLYAKMRRLGLRKEDYR